MFKLAMHINSMFTIIVYQSKPSFYRCSEHSKINYVSKIIIGYTGMYNVRP